MVRNNKRKQRKSKPATPAAVHNRPAKSSRLKRAYSAPSASESSVAFEIAPGGFRTGSPFLFLAGGLLVVAALCGMMLIGDPQAFALKFFVIIFGGLGIVFAYMAIDNAVRDGEIAIDGSTLRVHEKRLGRSRRLQKPLQDVLQISVEESSESLNNRNIRELVVATKQGDYRFFRYLPNPDLHTLAQELNRHLQDSKRLEVPSGVEDTPPAAGNAGQTFAHSVQAPHVARVFPTQAGTNRTVFNFLLACLPIVILLAVAGLISFVAGIHTLELTRVDQTHVRFSGTQRILSVVALQPKTIDSVVSAASEHSGTHEEVMTVVGENGSATVPGSYRIAEEIMAFVNDPAQQQEQFMVGNPLAECGAWVFAAFGLFLLTCVTVYTVEPIFKWRHRPATIVDLEHAPPCLTNATCQFPVEVYVGQIPWLRITHWKPGERIQFCSTRPLYMTLGGCVLLSSMTFYPLQLVFGFHLRKMLSWLPWGVGYAAFLFTLLPGILVAYLFVSALLPNRHVRFDFARGRVRWQAWHRRGSSNLGDVQQISLRAVRERFGGRTESPTYRSRIDLLVALDHEITLLDTERTSINYRDARPSQTQLEPFARALASALRLPLSQSNQPIEAPSLRRMLFLQQKPVLAIVALIIGLALSLIGFQIYRGVAERASIERIGGSVSSYSFAVAGQTLMARGRLYDFSDSELDDETFFFSVFPNLLRDRLPIALNLSGTNISDATVALLKEVPEIRILELKGCDIGDAAASSIADIRGLTYLTLTNTNVTDLGLESLGQARSLQYLYLGGDRAVSISNRGLKHLEQLRYLRELFLRNTLVTDAAVSEFQARLPDVEIRIPSF